MSTSLVIGLLWAALIVGGVLGWIAWGWKHRGR